MGNKIHGYIDREQEDGTGNPIVREDDWITCNHINCN